jgi:hypothetical protein
MQVVRMYAGEDGESHFEDVEIQFQAGMAGRVSKLLTGPGCHFWTVEGSYDLDFHTAPRRQLIVNLEGAVDIEVSDGAVRRMSPGSILMAEDTSGKGHKSKAVGGKPRQCVVIPLDENAEL